MSMLSVIAPLASVVPPATLPSMPDPTPAQLLAPIAFFATAAVALFVIALQLGWFRGARWSAPRCPTVAESGRLWIGAGGIVFVGLLVPMLMLAGTARTGDPTTPASDVVSLLMMTSVYLAAGIAALAIHATLGLNAAMLAIGLKKSTFRAPPGDASDGQWLSYASPLVSTAVAPTRDGWVVLLGAPFAIALTMAAASFTQLLRTLVGFHQPSAHALLLLMQRNERTPWVVVLTIVNATLLAPVAEEVLFRGHLQTALTSLFPKRWPAILITSMLFAGMHERWMIPPIFVLSVVIGYLYERTGNLWVAIATHVAFNATSTALFLASRGAI